MTMTLAPSDILFRIAAAVVAGCLLGLERERHGRPAGLKTMILACVASCFAMILSESYYLEAAALAHGALPDRTRMSAGILTGIGFLGAGAILRQGSSIRGVTTGAVLWYATILGMVCGSGKFWLAGSGILIALAVLHWIPFFEERLRRDGFAHLSIVLDLSASVETALDGLLQQHAVAVTDVQRGVDLPGGEKTIEYQLKFHRVRDDGLSRDLVGHLAGISGVRRVRWE